MAEEEKKDEGADSASASPATPNEDKSWFSTAARWQAADETIRTTAKWVITTLTGFTGLIFASGGFLVKGEFGSQYFWQRTLAMLAGAALAAGCLGGIIAVFAKALAPDEPSIGSIKASDLVAIEANTEAFFPGGVQNLDEFRAEYPKRELTALNARSGAQFAAAESDILKAELKDIDDRLGAKDLPPEERVALLPRREGVPEKLATAEKVAAIWDRDASKAESNWEQFRATRDTILGRVRYRSVKSSFKTAGRGLVALLVGLGLGAAAYTIAVSFKVDAAATPVAPQLARLTVADNKTGDRLWTAVSLEGCEVPGSEREVSVQLVSGDGTVSSPWKVKTVPSSTCPALSFPVVSGAGTVVVPETQAIKITYESEPE